MRDLFNLSDTHANTQHAKSFIKWVKSSVFYDLTYNDDKKVLQMINNIF